MAVGIPHHDFSSFSFCRETTVERLARAPGVRHTARPMVRLAQPRMLAVSSVASGSGRERRSDIEACRKALLHFVLNTVHKLQFECAHNKLGWTPWTHGRNDARRILCLGLVHNR